VGPSFPLGAFAAPQRVGTRRSAPPPAPPPRSASCRFLGNSQGPSPGAVARLWRPLLGAYPGGCWRQGACPRAVRRAVAAGGERGSRAGAFHGAVPAGWRVRPGRAAAPGAMAVPSLHKCLQVSGALGGAGPRGRLPAVRGGPRRSGAPRKALPPRPGLERAPGDTRGRRLWARPGLPLPSGAELTLAAAWSC